MGSDQKIFAALARRHMDALYSHALEREPDMQRVEELVQRTYQKAFDLFFAVRHDIDFQQWLFGLFDDTIRNQKHNFSMT